MGVMFITALPTAPLLVLAAGSTELRVDAYKLLVLQRFPEPRMVVGIGAPFNAFTFVTFAALVMNMAILLQINVDTQSASGGGSNYMMIMFPEMQQTGHLVVIFVVEHVMLLILYAISRMDIMSGTLRDEQYRQAYFESREGLEQMRREDGIQDKPPPHARKSTATIRAIAAVGVHRSSQSEAANAEDVVSDKVFEDEAEVQQRVGQVPGCIVGSESDG